MNIKYVINLYINLINTIIIDIIIVIVGVTVFMLQAADCEHPTNTCT